VTEQELFLEVFQIDDLAAREAYLDQACAGDGLLRQRIAGLLGALGRAGGFLESPGAAVEPGETVDCPSAVPAETEGGVVGPYKLLEQIGEGGFGAVYMAEQSQPVRRRVALKVLKPGMDTKQVVARFEAERQALAIMDHPNIAKVFDGGATPSGRPYFVMELVRGVPITGFCDQNQLNPQQRLELFIPVCLAVQHAHQKGIIHRDIKPTNVLVTLHDGIPVPKVIDFGIAKAMVQPLTERTLFTGFAQMVGTPLYMSPEQTEMGGLDVDTRTDIYALGVVLYELLTGTTPFDRDRFKKAGYDEIRRVIRDEEPVRPSTRISTLGPAAGPISVCRRSDPLRLRRLVRGELDWVAMKCLEKDRNRRYESASALAADIQRYLRDEPVQACPPSAWYRFRKLARRNRRTLVMGTVLASAAFGGVATLAVSTALVWKANQDLKASVERERREAYFQRITVAHREPSTDNLAAALRALGECPEELRGLEWHYLMRLCKVEPLVIRDKTGVIGAAFSPDGERLACAGGDGTVKIRDSRTGKRLQEFAAHERAACSVVFHPDGRHLATAGADGLVKIWNLDDGREVFREKCDALRKFGAAYTVAFRPPDGRHLAAGSDGAVTVWDWRAGQPLHSYSGHEHHSIPVAFSPDGRCLATGSSWRQGQSLWDADTGSLIRTWPAHRHPVTALAFDPDGSRLATASLDRSVKLWDRGTGEVLQTLLHTGNVLGVAFSPDGRRLASTGEDKVVRLWDPATGREVLGLRGHTDMCGCVAFSPDGRRLVSGSLDGTIRVWDATPLQGNESQETSTFTQHHDEIRSVVVSPDGERIVSAGGGGPVGSGSLAKVWNAATGEVIAEFPGHTILVWTAAWHPHGQRVATVGVDGLQHGVKVWDSRNGRELFAILSRGGKFAVPFLAAAFGPNPDGRYLVTGKQDGSLQIWDSRNGEKVRSLGSHTREIRGLVFSPDGQLLVSASGDGEIKFWDATRLDAEQEPRLPPIRARVPGPCLNVAFSPDSQRLVTGGTGNTIVVWDVKTGKDLLTLRGHSGEVYTVAFSPRDGRWIASGGEDSTVKIWDSQTGAEVATFRGHVGLVSSVAFSPDGKRVYSGSRDTTVKIWDLTKLNAEDGR
jgi:WD40 repeat protein/serine/threonine protein kinase